MHKQAEGGRKLVEQRLLRGIKEQLFTEEGLALYIKETSRLLTEKARQHRPEQDRAGRRLSAVEREIANLVNAIKQGIVTASTKAELERLEGEHARLKQKLTSKQTQTDKLVTMLPRAAERYRGVVENLGNISNATEAREQIRVLLGEVKLVPTPEGHLDAVLQGHYEGLLMLAVGRELNNVVAGRGFEPLTFGL